MASDARLNDIEAYYDAVPRTATRAEQIGPFTLFVRPAPGFACYARPSLGATGFTPADVLRVRERQRELDVPESFEWVAETTPALADAATSAGLHVSRHPLMLLVRAPERVAVADVRLATVDDDLPLLNAIAHTAFATPGTAVGPAGPTEARAAIDTDPLALASQQARLQSGLTVTAVVSVDGQPVAVGSHQPLGQATEIVGVGVLPAFRRRGLAAALTTALIQDAQTRHIHTIFLSAGDESIARIYARVGFERVGTACIAEPAASCA